MRKIVLAVVALVGAPACSGEAGGRDGDVYAAAPAAIVAAAVQLGAGAAAPEGVHRVQRAEIIDPSGFEKPMVASTIMVPVSWRPQGGVVWKQPGGCGAGYDVNWTATAPDGSGAVTLFPGEQWFMSNMNAAIQSPCPQMNVTTVRQYLEWFVQRKRPGARILDFRPRSDAAKPFEMLNSQENLGGGAEMRTWVEGGEVLIAYNDNGREYRESIAAVTVFMLSRIPDVMTGGSMDHMTGTSFTGYAYRAPAGELDFQFAEAVRKSLRTAPEWGRRIAQHNAEISRINTKGAADRSAIVSQANSEINDIIMGGWETRNASLDRTQRETVEAIRGVETYSDPYHGGTVELDNTFDHAWQLQDGSYVLTDNPNFSPGEFGWNGQELRPVQ